MGTRSYDPVTDLVVLVPGFLGFEEIGGYNYFDEVIVDTLRSALYAQRALSSERGSFAIETVGTVPAGGLLQRQASLLCDLCELLEYPSYRDVERVHLIGHSTGGLDARLLVAGSRLDGRPWALPEVRLRTRIRSVIGIGAPQHGTRLVGHPDLIALARSLPRFLADRALDPELWALLSSGLSDLDTAELVQGAIRRPAQALALVRSLACNNDLLRDLRPEEMRAHRDALPTLADVRFSSIVTVAAEHTELDGPPRQSGSIARLKGLFVKFTGGDNGPYMRRGDAIFRWLRARTANSHWEPDEAADARIEVAAAQRVQAVIDCAGAGGTVPVIGHPQAVLPCPIDGRTNDAIVNTARQLLCPTDQDELLAVVIGDHLDVIGHFDKVVDPRYPEDQGLIKSGSAFGQGQLHQLCDVLASGIDRARERPRVESSVVSVAAGAAESHA